MNKLIIETKIRKIKKLYKLTIPFEVVIISKYVFIFINLKLYLNIDF
jgi:hypothetical protein